MADVRAESVWLDQARMLIMRGQLREAQTTLEEALICYPASVDLRRAQAVVFLKTDRPDEAEALLQALLKDDAADSASAFALARLLKEQERMAAAALVLRACFAHALNNRNVNLAISIIELLDDCGRKIDAAAVAQDAITANPADARLHAYAGMLAIQLGEFERARRHYLFALERDERALEWHVPLGLASTQRYREAEHPDFELFRTGLQRTDLSSLARAELHFASGKAFDDIGDFVRAVKHFREGNAIRRSQGKWSRKAWRRATEARLGVKHGTVRAVSTEGFTPIFVVGMPRSGTTLLAELLSRHARVCNRGELAALARLAQDSAIVGTPDPAVMQRAAANYVREARQDDASGLRWFIDKQPLNFRYLDLSLAMFPDAKIIHCDRNARDNALSLWTQCFLEDVQGYSYDFDDIALVMSDCARLMEHWKRLYADSIKTIHYEELVAAPDRVIGELAEWIGLSLQPSDATAAGQKSSINTASLWQARQPVYSSSVGRWRHFVRQVPELLGFEAS